VEVLKSTYNFSDVKVEGLSRVDNCVHVPDLGKELPALQVLQNKVEALYVLKGTVQLNNEGVILLRKPLQYLLLPFNVLYLLRPQNFGLFDGLESVVALRGQIKDKSNSSEEALSKLLEQLEVFEAPLDPCFLVKDGDVHLVSLSRQTSTNRRPPRFDDHLWLHPGSTEVNHTLSWCLY